MKKLSLLLASVLVSFGAMAHTLNNPVGADGRYIVKYDMAKHQFAASNDFEADQTFTFAIDVTGTWLENYLKETPAAEGATRGVAVNKWTSKGTMNGDAVRLMQIEGNIYGATWNLAQLAAEEMFSEALMPDSVLYVYGQIFCFEFTADNPGAGWWMWSDQEVATTEAPGADCLFATKPYTGAYKSDNLYFDYENGAIFGFEITGYAAPGVNLEDAFDPKPEHLYILGNIANVGWEPAASAELTYEGNGIFTGVYTFEGEPAYFTFTTVQGSWDDVNANRFAGEANNLLTVGVPTKMLGHGDNMCFTVAAGTYEVVVNVGFAFSCTLFPVGATGVENIESAVKAVKVLENGQVVILKNGVRYNVLGAVVK